MRYGLKLAPQYTTLTDLRAVWQIADEHGFDHAWTYDHFASIGDELAGDVYEGWMLLAAMAEATERVRIGCMVTGNTYRHPGVLAKMASTVDHLSNGRLEFGLGAAWAQEEHTMLGLDFGTVGSRMDRFEEACQLIRALWTQGSVTFDGEHYQLKDAVSSPWPVQKPHPPIWVGGKGRKRSLRIAAEQADAWNATGVSPDEFAELSSVLDEHCAEINRDPTTIRRTVQLRVADDMNYLRATTKSFIDAGAEDVIYVVAGPDAVAHARAIATALPPLRKS